MHPEHRHQTSHKTSKEELAINPSAHAEGFISDVKFEIEERNPGAMNRVAMSGFREGMPSQPAEEREPLVFSLSLELAFMPAPLLL
jgi:hypothetical protein